MRWKPALGLLLRDAAKWTETARTARRSTSWSRMTGTRSFWVQDGFPNGRRFEGHCSEFFRSSVRSLYIFTQLCEWTLFRKKFRRPSEFFYFERTYFRTDILPNFANSLSMRNRINKLTGGRTVFRPAPKLTSCTHIRILVCLSACMTALYAK